MKTVNKLKSFRFIRTAILLVVAVFCFAFLLSINQTQAQQLDTGLSYASQIGLSDQDIRVTVAKIIRVIIGFLGIIALVLIIYAGWLWMSSEGREEKITQAKKILQNAVIGLIIILSSFAIASFIINKLTGAITGVSPAGGPTIIDDGVLPALGSGIIEAHFPARNATNIARNTNIVVTFKEAMEPNTIISGTNINSDNIKIYLNKNGSGGPFITEVSANKTDDNKTFLFNPVQYLGNASDKTWYTVELTKSLKKANGQAAFTSGTGGKGYSWSFEVGTFIDVTPPKIEKIIPKPDAIEPRNVVIQINFNEAVDPTSASGASTVFDNITVSTSAKIKGNFYISNQYKTVEFLTETACGINSCGNTVYCLPGLETIKVLADAASLISSGTPTAVFPYDGIVDMADNSLDGNGNGIAQGPRVTPYNANNPTAGGGDNYIWSFATNNTIDISGPVISSTTPAISQDGVGIADRIKAEYNKVLMSSSINSSSVNLSAPFPALINYWVGKSDDDTVTPNRTTINIDHDMFAENTNYKAGISSGLKDVYQNCFNPCSGPSTTGVCSGTPSCCEGLTSPSGTCP